MKRLEILFVNNGMVNFKNDFRYLVTQRENFNDVLVAFQTLEFDVVAFLKEDQESKTVAMINKLIEIQGRNKHVQFIAQSEVYERLKDESIPLIKYIFFSKEIFDNSIYSSFSALSKYSSLMDEKIQTIAIDEKQISKEDLELLKCDEEDAKYKIEVWNRDPFILSFNKAINPIYIIRLLNSIDDERTQYAVKQIEDELIKKFKDTNERD